MMDIAQKATLEKLRAAVREVPDFPQKGILFKDLTPLLSDATHFQDCIDLLSQRCRALQVDKIVGIDARGFIFGAALADRLRLGFVPIRKKGKLPAKTFSQAYQLEYGEAVLEIHRDALCRGERVALVDDLLATGGTAEAAVSLIREAGGEIGGLLLVAELTTLKGRERLRGVPVEALIEYN